MVKKVVTDLPVVKNLHESLSWVSLGIDQSINATGLCIMKGGKPVVLEVTEGDSSQGFNRVNEICNRIDGLITEFEPTIINMEEYASGVHSSSIMKLAELGGCIKLTAIRRGYDYSRDAVLTGKRVFMVTGQASMKKFMLGSGATKKDSAYLLKVYNALNTKFDDDNKADAYMHAWMCLIVVAVARGHVPIDTLLTHQQEALIGPGVRRKKGLSMNKAMKLPASEKLKLVGF